VFISSTAFAEHLHKEKEYQDAWCKKMQGQTEVILDDKTRVDCLTDQYAVEVDFAPKWAEGIGQALFYGLKTGMRPGVLLIMENYNDDRFLERLKLTAEKYGISTWMITPEEL
jgi:hypothetical protein